MEFQSLDEFYYDEDMDTQQQYDEDISYQCHYDDTDDENDSEEDYYDLLDGILERSIEYANNQVYDHDIQRENAVRLLLMLEEVDEGYESG